MNTPRWPKFWMLDCDIAAFLVTEPNVIMLNGSATRRRISKSHQNRARTLRQ